MNFFQDKSHLYFYENEQEFRILYKEIFKDEIYKTEIKQTPRLIIDIGAHIGLATLYFRKQFPNTKIISYEPNPSTFEILIQNININGIQNIELKNSAITNKAGETTLYIDNKNSWNSTASTLPNGWNDTQKLTPMIIRTESFESVLDLEPDLIKIDIEGIEQSLIKNNIEKLSKVKNLIIEFHQSTQQDLRKMLKLLSKAGFTNKVVEDKVDKGLAMIYSTH